MIPRRTAYVLLAAAAALVVNTSCAKRGALLRPGEYMEQNDDPADLYRVTTAEGRVYMATEIAVTDSTVVIRALEHQDDDELLFGATRYADVELPLVLERADVLTLERMRWTARGMVNDSVGVLFMGILLLFVTIGLAWG